VNALPKLERIRATALKLLEKEGPEGVSMRRVAADSGITAMAIYHYFPSREALLDDITQAVFVEFGKQLASKSAGGTLNRRFRTNLDAFLDFALSRPRVYDYIISQPRAGARRYPKDFEQGKSPTFTVLAELCAEGVRTGHLRKGEVWEIALTLAAETQGLLTLYRGGRFAISENEFRKLCHRSSERVLHGLKKTAH
jgi:AcrR family transcriptional regulator